MQTVQNAGSELFATHTAIVHTFTSCRMDLLKRSIWKSVPNLSKIFHENEILSQKGVQSYPQNPLPPTLISPLWYLSGVSQKEDFFLAYPRHKFFMTWFLYLNTFLHGTHGVPVHSYIAMRFQVSLSECALPTRRTPNHHCHLWRLKIEIHILVLWPTDTHSKEATLSSLFCPLLKKGLL